MAYVQKGLRWIPSYKVTLTGNGRARVQLQATLVNELADLDNVTAHLVVGVPSFAFRDTIDPVALQERVTRLGPLFDASTTTSQALSNAIVSQVAGTGDTFARGDRQPPNGADLGPEVTGER